MLELDRRVAVATRRGERRRPQPGRPRRTSSRRAGRATSTLRGRPRAARRASATAGATATIRSGDRSGEPPAPDVHRRRRALEAATPRLATRATAPASVEVTLPARGLHYAVDAAGATAMARAPARRPVPRRRASAARLASLPTVYGRGEMLDVGGEDIEIIMMKNPPSLQLNLDCARRAPEQVFVAVDEGTPDPSWIYDIDLVDARRTSTWSPARRRWQFATRFGYDGIPVGVGRARAARRRSTRSSRCRSRRTAHKTHDRQLRADDADPQAARLPRPRGRRAMIVVAHPAPLPARARDQRRRRQRDGAAQRARWRGIEIEVVTTTSGGELPDDADLVHIGSGPLSSQRAVLDDLQRIAPTLRAWRGCRRAVPGDRRRLAAARRGARERRR